MTKLEQAARQALSTDEALMALELILRDGIEHGNWPLNKNCEDGLEAITALRSALVESEALAEQAEQEEPVSMFNWRNGSPVSLRHAAPVSAKREWVDLTDDEMWDVFISKDWTGEPLQLMSAVITAFKEKNKC